MNALTFGRGNAKLDKAIYTFSLPAGHSCPGADKCLAKANRETGQITDGTRAVFRCFSASAEAAFPSVRESRWKNWLALREVKTTAGMADLLLANLPADASIVRIHVGGDFYSDAYFLAWCQVAAARPSVRFYAYTKSILSWKRHFASVPSNLILTASEGGRWDDQINGFKRAKVVFSEEQAAALGLAIDHDDSHAYEGSESFALLLHGTQAKGTVAAKALSALRAEGKGGYSNSKKYAQYFNNK